MIYELFMLNDEIDLLEIKLEELFDFVDKFIVIESTHTHTNLPKKLHYVENEYRFAKYKDKIIHIVCNFSNTDLYRDRYALYKELKPITEVWFREHFQRDFGLVSGQIKFDDEDIIIITDLDEIVNKHTLSKFIKENGIDKIYRLGMSLHYYKFNLRVPFPRLWRHSYIAKYKHLKEFNGAISYIRHDYKFLSPEYHEILIENMGWHFTYLMSVDQIVNGKFKHFAHANDDVIKNISNEEVADSIKNKMFFNDVLEECPISELPETIVKLYKFIKYFNVSHP